MTSSTVRVRQEWALAAADLVTAVNLDYPVDTVVSKIAEHALGLLNLDMCAVMLADGLTNQLKVAGSAGLSDSYIQRLHSEHPLRVVQIAHELPSPSVEAYITQRTISVPDIEQFDGMAEWRQLALEEGYEALIATPLVEGELTTGVLVGYSRRRRQFPSDEVELLAMFAVHAASSILAARRRDELQTTVEELNVANSELRRQRHHLEVLDRQHHRLMQVLANDVGVAGVATMLAEMLDCSVTVEDLAGRTLASAAKGTYVSPPKGVHRETAEVAKALSQAASAKARVVEVPRAPSSACPFWVTAVMLHGDVVGFLWIGRPGFELDEPGRQGIEQFVPAVALELSKQRSAVQVRIQLSRDLMADLLSEVRDSDRVALLERALALGWDLTRPARMLVARPDVAASESPRHGIVEVADSVMRNRTTAHLVGGLNGQAIVILDAEDAEPAKKIGQAIIDEFGKRNLGGTASAFVTAVVDDVSELAGHYRLAKGALDLMERGRRGTVIHSEDVGAAYLLLSHGDPAALQRFADRILEPLDVLDPLRRTEMVDTLQAWFNCEFSTGSAAKQLRVHTNTVSYRIKAIEDRMGRSLRDPVLLSDLTLALAVRRVAGVTASA